jgi:hypothetical protein
LLACALPLLVTADQKVNGLSSAQHIRARQAILVPMAKAKNAQNVGDVY